MGHITDNERSRRLSKCLTHKKYNGPFRQWISTTKGCVRALRHRLPVRVHMPIITIAVLALPSVAVKSLHVSKQYIAARKTSQIATEWSCWRKAMPLLLHNCISCIFKIFEETGSSRTKTWVFSLQCIPDNALRGLCLAIASIPCPMPGERREPKSRQIIGFLSCGLKNAGKWRTSHTQT